MACNHLETYIKVYRLSEISLHCPRQMCLRLGNIPPQASKGFELVAAVSPQFVVSMLCY